jgi:hypothetical protein
MYAADVLNSDKWNCQILKWQNAVKQKERMEEEAGDQGLRWELLKREAEALATLLRLVLHIRTRKVVIRYTPFQSIFV